MVQVAQTLLRNQQQQQQQQQEQEDVPGLLKRLQRAHMKRASAVLFEHVGTVEAVIRLYLKDAESTHASQVFEYIRRCGQEEHRDHHNNGRLEALRSTVLSLLPDLTKVSGVEWCRPVLFRPVSSTRGLIAMFSFLRSKLDRNRAAQVVLMLFPDQHETVIQKLHDPWLQVCTAVLSKRGVVC